MKIEYEDGEEKSEKSLCETGNEMPGKMRIT